MDIVILDGYTENPGDLDWEGMASMGRLTVHDRTPPEQIVERIGKAEIVIVNKAPITRETMMVCRGIRYIGMLATGYNVVDVVAARELGIIVSNIPTYGTQAVAQFAIAMLLEICHHIGDHADSVQKGQWTKSPDFCYWNSPLIELAGKTMGVIGFGRIGQATARIAQALGMSVLPMTNSRIHPSKAMRCIILPSKNY
jgi:glycerate dehydrogenase